MEDLNSELSPEGLGFLMAFGAVFIIIAAVAYIFYGFCWGKVFEKAGKPMWAGFVPIYNFVVWMEIIGRPWWWVVVLIGVSFIPIIGSFAALAILILFGIDTAKSFGKDTAFGVLFGIFSFVMLPVLAFGDAQYKGPSPTPIGN